MRRVLASSGYRGKKKTKGLTWRTEDQRGQVLGHALEGLGPAQRLHVHGGEDVVEAGQRPVLHPLHPAGETPSPSSGWLCVAASS